MKRRYGSSVGLLGLMLALFAASILHTSVGIYQENQAVQAPLMERLNDPSLYPGDPFAEALVRYPSILWHVVAPLARLVPMGPLLLFLFLLERLAGLYAAGRLARAFAPGSTLAAAGAMSLFAFAIRPILGAGTIVEAYFEQTGVAIVLLLFAGAAFYEHRPWSWAVWTGLAFDATGLYGAYALAYFGAAFLIDVDYRRQWRRWLGPSGLLVLISLPAGALALRALGAPLQDKALWLAASYARGWRHMYPGAWPLRDYLETGALLGVLCLFLLIGGRASGKLSRHAAIWTCVAASWLCLAFLAAYVLASPALLILQPARATDLWVCFASIAIVAIGARAVEEAFSSVQPLDPPLAAGSEDPAWPLAEDERETRAPSSKRTQDPVNEEGSAARSVARALTDRQSAARHHRFRTTAMTIPFLRRALRSMTLFGPILFWRPAGWLIAAACLLLVVAWPRLWRFVVPNGQPNRIAWLLAFWVCASGVYEFRQRYEDVGALDALVVRPAPAISEIAAWAKDHTARDAVFLLDPGDPEWEPFRALSGRTIYTSWEEGTAINWSPNFVVEWARRMRLLGYDVRGGPPRSHRTLRNLYARLTEKDVSKIRAEVPFRYWIVLVDRPSGFLEAFRAGDFKVLDLEGEILLP